MKAEEMIREAADMKAELTEKRKYLHAHAETGFALQNTSKTAWKSTFASRQS